MIFHKFKVISLSFESPFMHIKHLKCSHQIMLLDLNVLFVYQMCTIHSQSLKRDPYLIYKFTMFVCLSDTTFCTGNLRGRFCNPSLCPFIRPSVRLSWQFCVLIHRQNRPLHFLWQNQFYRWIKMKRKKRSPKRRSLFFNVADMQLASQLRLLTRLLSPSGNNPTFRVLRITQRMTWPTHAPAVLSVLQGRAGGRAGGRAEAK
jgi:hypothetical protein